MTEAASIRQGGGRWGWSSNRRGVAAAVAALGILLLGVWSLDAVQRWWAVVMIKTPARLSRPLPTLPLELGPFKRFGDMDNYLQPDEVAQLGTEDYLLRHYEDRSVAEHTPGRMVALNLNFYAVGSATPHVPRVCWAANGMQEEGNRIITVKDVPHKDGSRSDLRMQMLWFSGKQIGGASQGILGAAQEQARYLNVAYMFQVNDGYVATGEEVTRHFWKPDAKYAYHTKIEVTVVEPCTPDEAQPVVEKFIRASLAEIERCLPDPKDPGGKAAGAGVQASVEGLGH